MAILSGRYGSVSYDSGPASPVNPVEISSLNGWTISLKTDYEDVTCFKDTNRVYVPGMRDASGTLTGFWDSAASTVLTDASAATTPGYLKLSQNDNEAAFYFGGLAYLDVDINCMLAAPKISGSWKAAGAWTLP